MYKTNTANWSVTVKSAVLLEGMLFLAFHAVKRTRWTTTSYWQLDEFARLDAQLTPAFGDQHYPAANNTDDRYLQGYIHNGVIYMRAQRPTDVGPGVWFQLNAAFPIA